MFSPARRTLLGGLAAALAAPVSAAEPTRVPFKIVSGKIFAPVVVNDVPAEAVLDTGSALSSIDAGFAVQARVVGRGRFTGAFIQGRLSGSLAADVPMGVASACLKIPRMAVLDYSALSRQLGRPVQAVIGRELFDAFVVDFDFERKLMSVEPRGFAAPPPGAQAVPLWLEPRGAVTEIRIEDAPPIRVLVDIGNDLPLILSPSGVTRKLLQGRRVSTALIGGAGSQAVAQTATLRKLSLGGFDLAGAPVSVAPRAIGFAGNLGLPVLSRFRLTLDFAGRRMRLSPNGAFAQPFEKDRTGLNGYLDQGYLRIIHVARGGPAERAGFRAGDLVAAIEGEAAATANANLASAPSGRTLEFTLADGRKRRLTLAEYY